MTMRRNPKLRRMLTSLDCDGESQAFVENSADAEDVFMGLPEIEDMFLALFCMLLAAIYYQIWLNFRTDMGTNSSINGEARSVGRSVGAPR